MKLSLIYVSFRNKRKGLNAILFLMKLFNVYTDHVIVENKSTGLDKGDNVIFGSNELQDYSGYLEGLKYLNSKYTCNEYILFVNDTFCIHRYFGFVAWLSLSYRFFFIKAHRYIKPIAYFPLSGCGIGETLYNIPVQATMSSYMFIMNKFDSLKFFNCFYNHVIHDINLVGGKVVSVSNSISKNYLDELNGYLGFSQCGSLGEWYNLNNVSVDIRLQKARCLILERIIPSYLLLHGFEISHLTSSYLTRKLNRFESLLKK